MNSCVCVMDLKKKRSFHVPNLGRRRELTQHAANPRPARLLWCWLDTPCYMTVAQLHGESTRLLYHGVSWKIMEHLCKWIQMVKL